LAACVTEPRYEGRLCDQALACPEGFACGSDGRCHHACEDDSECLSVDEACVASVCTAITGRSDGGVARRDAAARDSAPAECSGPEDCVRPGSCELSAGARCERGVCVYERVTCLSAPRPECIDADSVFVTYSNIGACLEESGVCEYSATRISCPDCSAICLAPCAGVTCDDDQGGCRSSGFCVPAERPGEPPECRYVNSEDETRCVRESPPGAPGVCFRGECFECARDEHCDDGNFCTNDFCDLATRTCVHPASGGSAEVCDGVDNDCDGRVDENLTRGCSNVCGSGTETCTAGVWGGCTARVPATEVCDNFDNDCDGRVDESLSRGCSSVCGSGTEVCAGGSWGWCTARQPSAEVCDGMDNDCDGATDEGFTWLFPNSSLAPGQWVSSCSGNYQFHHQTDGNVVLYNLSTGAATWASNTYGQSTTTLIMQPDGNLVLYFNGTPRWASNTCCSNPNSYLAVQDDGNVVIYTSGGAAIWATNTSGL
jgi:hypothetical protein